MPISPRIQTDERDQIIQPINFAEGETNLPSMNFGITETDLL
jgi:hypothetical protein